ncbi:gastrula zinc finger protein XlCGF66.1-like isoform X6 [Bufo gargarizans]|uniref:gastrula zinc finger protein XlCGF66.1-like isoform X6 n=1 Tax=Bufo gargarizans TaxID=30331 RepID=UPI001CF1A22F|nr:gastrula zinc finger protein XlCGF66.1-like isoform X6 [Bufo gargarizans]
MDGDGDKMAERMLDLTLEILLLLTGEDYSTVKKTSSNLMHEKNNEKILEVVHKMMELLTGEVPLRCQDVAVYFSMEEWEYLEGDKGLYKEVKMEEDQPLTSPERSSQRTTPERCPRPLLPQDGQSLAMETTGGNKEPIGLCPREERVRTRLVEADLLHGSHLQLVRPC